MSYRDVERMIAQAFETLDAGDDSTAEAWFREAVDRCRESGFDQLRWEALSGLGTAERHLGRADRARRHHVEATELARDLAAGSGEGQNWIAHSLLETGLDEIAMERFKDAGAVLDAALQVDLIDGDDLAIAADIAAEVGARLQDAATAMDRLRRIGALVEDGDTVAGARLVHAHARLAVAAGEPEAGLRLFAAAAEAALRHPDWTAPPSRHHEENARRRLGPEEAMAAWAEGRRMSVTEALRFAES